MNAPHGYQEVTGTQIFKFEKIGQDLEGRLVSRGRVEIEDKESGKKKPVVEYTLEKSDGSRVRLLPSWDLADKLAALPLRTSQVVICYEEDKPIREGQSPMKIFRVWQKPVKAKVSDAALEITDDDVPF